MPAAAATAIGATVLATGFAPASAALTPLPVALPVPLLEVAVDFVFFSDPREEWCLPSLPFSVTMLPAGEELSFAAGVLLGVVLFGVVLLGVGSAAAAGTRAAAGARARSRAAPGARARATAGTAAG